MLVSKTSAAAFPFIRFRGLARGPQKRACVPSLARVPGVAWLPIPGLDSSTSIDTDSDPDASSGDSFFGCLFAQSKRPRSSNVAKVEDLSPRPHELLMLSQPFRPALTNC